MLLATVAVPVPLGRAFSYSVPDALGAKVVAGSRVLVSFGRRSIVGVVLQVQDREPDIPAEKIKPLRALVDEEPVLPGDLLAFLMELGRYYLAPIGEVMRLALPAVERRSKERLERQGMLEGAKLSSVGRLVQVVHAVELPPAGAERALRGQAVDALAMLRETGPMVLSVLEKRFGNARAATKRLEALGLVRVERQEQSQSDFFAQAPVADTAPQPTGPQAAALDAIGAALRERHAGAFLLHGVTGSGKTEVYLRCVQKAISEGGSAIVLVPEIALTPQLVSRFRARLGDEIAVLHSGLSETERHGMWRRLRSGELKVAIGARSALFAPVVDLAIVCVDEEHDTSFKQEEGVRYNARDMALLRAHRAGAVCVLGSATPSLSSESLVRSGKLRRLVLPDRAHEAAVLPEVEIVDVKRIGAGPTGDRLISVHLHRALEDVLERGQQAILFLNRRGFAPSLICDSCGAIAQCPNCAVALTLHRAHRPVLLCHHCDYSAPSLGVCSSCRSPQITEAGAGTERVEAVLRDAFPTARVGRLDRDVAAGLKSEQVIDRMRAREIDILVGTQMVTKGHDLPNVTLVGVLNADAALSLPDYQATERTFHLLVQVAGRAGRGSSRGKVLIQTRNPDHVAIRMAMQHDVEAFVEHELRERQELNYPPYSRLVMVRIDAADERLARVGAEQLASVARAAAGAGGVEVLGPSPAPIARLRNRYRFRFLLRARTRSALREPLLAVARTQPDRRVRVVWDVDPVNML